MALLPKLIALVLSRRRRGGGGGGGGGGGYRGGGGGGYRGGGGGGSRGGGGYGGRGRAPLDPVEQQQRYAAAQYGKMVNAAMADALKGPDLQSLFLQSAGLNPRRPGMDSAEGMTYEDLMKLYMPEDDPLDGLLE